MTDQFYNQPISSLTLDELIRITLEICGTLDCESISRFIADTYQLDYDTSRVKRSVTHHAYKHFFTIHDWKVSLSPAHINDREVNPTKWRKLDAIINATQEGSQQGMFDDDYLSKQYDELANPRKKRK
tara:strand:- start:4227 stop:4610 length:384 start_codon:yes stop_codon:yes gene_type:complete